MVEDEGSSVLGNMYVPSENFKIRIGFSVSLSRESKINPNSKPTPPKLIAFKI